MDFLANMRLNSSAGPVAQARIIRGALRIEVLQGSSVLCERKFQLECRATPKGRRFELQLYLTAGKERVFSYQGLIGKNVDAVPLTDDFIIVQLLVVLVNTCIGYGGIYDCLIDFEGTPPGTDDRLLALCRGVAH